MGGNDIAQICLNGHVVNSKTLNEKARNQDFCSRCGEKTTTVCLSCDAKIKGSYYFDTLPLSQGKSELYVRPTCCYKCGAEYPWTGRVTRAAIELMTEDGSLTVDEQKVFNESILEISHDTPRSALAATRIKKLLSSAAGVTATALHEILVDVVSETAKKILYP